MWLVPNIRQRPSLPRLDICHAYGASGLGLSGARQTSAILIDTFPVDADLTAFWTKNSVAGSLAQIQKVNAAWQAGRGVPRGNMRLAPDVGAAADPKTGAYLIFHGAAVEIGGTSWSAPIRAGFCALLNEERRRAGKPPLPYLDPYLYHLIGGTMFRDITVGSNGAYHCGPGYDEVTGIGAPLLRELMARLMATP